MLSNYNQTGQAYIVKGILTTICGLMVVILYPIFIFIPLGVGLYYILKAQGYRNNINSVKTMNPGQRIQSPIPQPMNTPPCASCGIPLTFDSVINQWMCGNSGCEKYQQKL
jgi:hypothetical protein